MDFHWALSSVRNPLPTYTLSTWQSNKAVFFDIADKVIGNSKNQTDSKT